MQSTLISAFAVRPAVMAVASTPRAAAPAFNRRAVASFLLAVVPALTAAAPALALIPDDDDLDLVVKARANRSARLSSEKTTEARFSVIESGPAKKVGPLAAAQKAVRKLSRSAAALDAGSATDAADALSGTWAADFAVAAAALSGEAGSPAGKAAAAAVSAVDAYVVVARSGDLSAAKAGFVGAATALQGWAKAAGLAAQLTGL